MMHDQTMITQTQKALRVLMGGQPVARRVLFHDKLNNKLNIKKWPGWHYRVLSKLVADKLIELQGAGKHVVYRAIDVAGIRALLADPIRLSKLLWAQPDENMELKLGPIARSLGRDFAALEASEPAVAEAAHKFDAMRASIIAQPFSFLAQRAVDAPVMASSSVSRGGPVPQGFGPFVEAWFKEYGLDNFISASKLLGLARVHVDQFDQHLANPHLRFGQYLAKCKTLNHNGFFIESHKWKGWALHRSEATADTDAAEDTLESPTGSGASGPEVISPQLQSLLEVIADSLHNLNTSIQTVYNKIKKLEEQKSAVDSKKGFDRCSFCVRSSESVSLLFPGNGASICNECITVAASLLRG